MRHRSTDLQEEEEKEEKKKKEVITKRRVNPNVGQIIFSRNDFCGNVRVCARSVRCFRNAFIVSNAYTTHARTPDYAESAFPIDWHAAVHGPPVRDIYFHRRDVNIPAGIELLQLQMRDAYIFLKVRELDIITISPNSYLGRYSTRVEQMIPVFIRERTMRNLT